MAYTTITDPSAHFQIALYTGNGTSTNAVTNTGNSNLQPDWLWLKARSITADHIIFDSTRGTNKRLSTNTTGAEETQAFCSYFDRIVVEFFVSLSTVDNRSNAMKDFYLGKKSL